MILTQQVSNYHAARYCAAQVVFQSFSVVSVMNDADFPEFLSAPHSSHAFVQLFEGRGAYLRAVSRGQVWSATQAALDRLRPDIVAVAGWSFPESLAAISWARGKGARVVMMSDSQKHDGPRYRLREAIKSRVVKACDAALVGGASHAAYVEDLGISHARVFCGYDIVDNCHFENGAVQARMNSESLRREYSLPDRYLLASARFIPKKNLKRLVVSFGRALSKSSSGHKLVILGDGPGRQALESIIAVEGLGASVLLPGFKGYDKLPVYYGLAEAFVHIPWAEQWGLVLNEAAAAGLPLIASRSCGATAELVADGINGYVVNPNDASDVIRALVTVMRASPQERDAMGVHSRRIVAKWGPDRFADGLSRAAEAALACSSRRLSLLDQVILRILSRRYISAVS